MRAVAAVVMAATLGGGTAAAEDLRRFEPAIALATASSRCAAESYREHCEIEATYDWVAEHERLPNGHGIYGWYLGLQGRAGERRYAMARQLLETALEHYTPEPECTPKHRRFSDLEMRELARGAVWWVIHYEKTTADVPFVEVAYDVWEKTHCDEVAWEAAHPQQARQEAAARAAGPTQADKALDALMDAASHSRRTAAARGLPAPIR